MLNGDESIFRELQIINERIQTLNNNYYKLNNYLVDDTSTNTPGLVNRLKIAETKIENLIYKDKSRKERLSFYVLIFSTLIELLKWIFTIVIKKL